MITHITFYKMGGFYNNYSNSINHINYINRRHDDKNDDNNQTFREINGYESTFKSEYYYCLYVLNSVKIKYLNSNTFSLFKSSFSTLFSDFNAFL